MTEFSTFPKNRIISIFFLLAFFYSCNSINKNLKLKTESEILTVINLSAIAWNRGSLEEYMQAYWQSDSLKFVGGKVISFGWQNTLDRYKKSYPDKATMGNLEFHDLNFVNISNDFATVSGSWYLQRKDDNLQGRFTLVLKKFPQGWLIIYDHSS